MARAIMIQGAGSNVGKSIFVAGLARHFARAGLKVAPFKPQNMSNNAAVTADGGEIGRAQALQARAAMRAPLIDMNPVLLKPETDTGAQVIVQGQRHGALSAREFSAHKAALMPRIVESFDRLARDADLVLVEGAGSPAEINLRQGDLANMGFAEAADLPVIMLGDIDRGGVIAQLAGTQRVLSSTDAARIKGFVINKFRGDPALFEEGLAAIEGLTGWASLGVLPWYDGAARLPAEDILDLRARPNAGGVKIAVPRLGRMANFDDLDPLSAEPGLAIDIVEPGRALPGDAALVLIPGSKNTIADLEAFRANGWDIDLTAHIRRGGHVLGICGGFQMLGRAIHDPEGLEGRPGSHGGLGHLDVETVLKPRKTLSHVAMTERETGQMVRGYEIHLGETTGPDCANSWLAKDGAGHGAATLGGRVRGCYVHGLFSDDAFRAGYLARIGASSQTDNFEAGVESALDGLADHIAAHVDTGKILSLAAG